MRLKIASGVDGGEVVGEFRTGGVTNAQHMAANRDARSSERDPEPARVFGPRSSIATFPIGGVDGEDDVGGGPRGMAEFMQKHTAEEGQGQHQREQPTRDLTVASGEHHQY